MTDFTPDNIIETPRRTESGEQIAVMGWAAAHEGVCPQLILLHHNPMGRYRPKKVGAMLKKEGAKSGVPDLFLPVARHGYHGLFLELKVKGGRLQPSQTAWIGALKIEGYRVTVCWSADTAIGELCVYLGIGE